jgi:threonylcarbamoyladenosine tRNA methylthiotransferase MtaB
VLTETVKKEERARRAARLRELSLHRFEEMAKNQIGKQKTVLVLRNAARGGSGLSEDYYPVDILGAESFLEAWVGQEVKINITSYDHSNKQHMEGHLVGEVVSE